MLLCKRYCRNTQKLIENGIWVPGCLAVRIAVSKNLVTALPAQQGLEESAGKVRGRRGFAHATSVTGQYDRWSCHGAYRS